MKLNIKDKSLAINGGNKIRNKPWLDNFLFGEEEKKAVSDVIDTGYLSKFEGNFYTDPPFSFKGGPYVQKLEDLWCERYNSKYAVSINSATSGLSAAIGALRIGYGDEVIVSAGTMTACAMAPLIYGAIPIFADVNKFTGNITAESFQNLITPRTKAIIVVHTYGIPADMDEIVKIARDNNISVIEDCAQAHGTTYKNKTIGTLGDIGVFSLNVNKQINCGEGGVCITNNEDLAFRIQLIRNHGETSTAVAKVEDITNIAGYNYRLTEVQAAIAIEQLKKLDEYNKIRIEFAEYLNKNLKRFEFLKTIDGCNNCNCEKKPNCYSTYYQWPIMFDLKKLGVDILKVREILNAEGMYFIRAWKPLYRQPLYQQKKLFKHNYPFDAEPNKSIKTNYHEGSCPNVEWIYENVLLKEYLRYPTTLDDVKQVETAMEKLNKAITR
jgi:perosamine synthetase